MKQKFIEFVSSTLMGIDGDLSCSTDDIINMIPDFIEYLGDW
jgi:hypothetical protein